MTELRFRIVLWIFAVVASACVPAADLTGSWENETSLLEIRSDMRMVLSVEKIFQYEGEDYPVLLVPGSDGAIHEAVELKKCDPQSCFTDIKTLETFEYEGSWREIQAAVDSYDFTYRVIDETRIQIEPASERVPPVDLSGTAMFAIVGEELTLTFEDGRVLRFQR